MAVIEFRLTSIGNGDIVISHFDNSFSEIIHPHCPYEGAFIIMTLLTDEKKSLCDPSKIPGFFRCRFIIFSGILFCNLFLAVAAAVTCLCFQNNGLTVKNWFILESCFAPLLLPLFSSVALGTCNLMLDCKSASLSISLPHWHHHENTIFEF